MKYIFEINIFTDGDFGIPFVPAGMKYDGEYNYSFRKEYTNRNIAIESAIEICTFLKDYMETSRDNVKESWNSRINSFIRRLKESTESVHERVESYMGGNYEGTEWIFRAEPLSFDFSINVTDEEYRLIRSNRSIGYSEIKKAILELYNNDTPEEKSKLFPEHLIVPRGTPVKYYNGRLGIVDWNDSESSEAFESINYCICPMEFIHMKTWSDCYVWLLRDEFEILVLKDYITDESEIEKIMNEYLNGTRTMQEMLNETYCHLPPEDKFNLICWASEYGIDPFEG